MPKIRWRRVAAAYVSGAIVCIVLLLAARAKLAASTADAFRPRLIVNTRSHDFGSVPAGQILQKDFLLHNRGSSRVVVGSASNGCCGGDLPEQVIVPPGGDLELPLVLDTTGKRGKVTRTVSVATSDPVQPRIDFELAATVSSLK